MASPSSGLLTPDNTEQPVALGEQEQEPPSTSHSDEHNDDLSNDNGNMPPKSPLKQSPPALSNVTEDTVVYAPDISREQQSSPQNAPIEAVLHTISPPDSAPQNGDPFPDNDMVVDTIEDVAGETIVHTISPPESAPQELEPSPNTEAVKEKILHAMSPERPQTPHNEDVVMFSDNVQSPAVSQLNASELPNGISEQPPRKKQRVEYPPMERIEARVIKSEDHPFFDDKPNQLLRRSIALIFQHVGFDGATKEALETVVAQAETYSQRFLAHINATMLNARRTQPIPPDFEYALASMDLPLASLEPHLKHPISKSKLTDKSEMVDERIPWDASSIPSLKGEAEEKPRSYIPKGFPPLPSRHTYQFTDKFPFRETDPRKIREEAAKQARQGEEALRRLMDKPGKAKRQKELAMRGTERARQKYLKWEAAMISLGGGTEEGGVEDKWISNINWEHHPRYRKSRPEAYWKERGM